jgi:hypothetical protein
MSTPLFDTQREELTVTVGGKPTELTFKEVLKSIAESLKKMPQILFEHRTWLGWNKALETRRHPDTHEEVDYELRLRELEGQLNDRELRGFRMGDYHEKGGSKWDKYAIPGLVTLAVSGIIGNVVQAMQVSALRQEVTDLKAEVNDIKKLVEPRYRGTP